MKKIFQKSPQDFTVEEKGIIQGLVQLVIQDIIKGGYNEYFKEEN